jgi:hypothetical protein
MCAIPPPHPPTRQLTHTHTHTTTTTAKTTTTMLALHERLLENGYAYWPSTRQSHSLFPHLVEIVRCSKARHVKDLTHLLHVSTTCNSALRHTTRCVQGPASRREGQGRECVHHVNDKNENRENASEHTSEVDTDAGTHIAPHRTAPHRTTPHRTAQHSAAHRSTAQHSTSHDLSASKKATGMTDGLSTRPALPWSPKFRVSVTDTNEGALRSLRMVPTPHGRSSGRDVVNGVNPACSGRRMSMTALPRWSA